MDPTEQNISLKLNSKPVQNLTDECLTTTENIKNELTELLAQLKQRHHHVSSSNFDVVINKFEPNFHSPLIQSATTLTTPPPPSTSRDPARLKAKLENVEKAINSANKLLQDPKVFNDILTARQKFIVDACTDDSDDDNWTPKRSQKSEHLFDITNEVDQTIDDTVICYPDEIICFFVEKLIAQYKQIQGYIAQMLIKK